MTVTVVEYVPPITYRRCGACNNLYWMPKDRDSAHPRCGRHQEREPLKRDAKQSRSKRGGR